MTGPVLCTVAAPNYLPLVRVLARSLAETDPGLPLRVLLVTRGGKVPAGAEGLAVLTPADLNDPRAGKLRRRYGIKACCAALKPFLLTHLLDEGHGPVLFLDPDMLATASLAPVMQAVAAAPLTLCPHLLRPAAPEGQSAVERTLLTSGLYNAGLIGATDHPESRAFLAWWAERLATHCIGEPSAGYHFDQRWLDLAPSFVPGLHLLRDPGCNLGHWNIEGRRITGTAPALQVDGAPLRLFHFSGFDPARPGRLTRYERHRIVTGTPLQGLFEFYAERLRAEGCRAAIGAGWAETLRETLLLRARRLLG